MAAAPVTNQEYHDLLDDLTESRFFGEITLFFQGGNIESSRKTERKTKSEIRDLMGEKKRRRVLVPRTVGASSG